jgi:hypothetical protein
MNQIRNGKCAHGNVVCSRCVTVTDAARRMSDMINATITFRTWDDLKHSYMAFRLDDGSTTGTLYDSKADAIRFTDEKYHAYFCFRQGMGGVSPADCQLFLDVHRQVYDSGMRLNDPDLQRPGQDLIISTRGYDIMRGKRGVN